MQYKFYIKTGILKLLPVKKNFHSFTKAWGVYIASIPYLRIRKAV